MHPTPQDPAFQKPAPFAKLVALLLLGVGLIAVLMLHLLAALFTGLTVFVLHRTLLAWLTRRVPHRQAQWLAFALVLLVITLTLTGAVMGLDDFGIGAANGALFNLMNLLETSLDKLRTSLPAGVAEHLPASVEALRTLAAKWLQEHMADLRTWGAEALRISVHILVGLVIGLLVSASTQAPAEEADMLRPFPKMWRQALARLAQVFSLVMGAQIRIAALNAALTAVYLFMVVPLLGERIPLSKTLVSVTFVASLIPVLGNLISNTAVVLAALVVSPFLAALSLAFLVTVHKLEYFLNATLIGGRIQARTYELLTVMIIMEALFGLGGVVAAPVYYAWVMGVLRDEHWI
jgi:predicted PurR-regulated permease PerM